MLTLDEGTLLVKIARRTIETYLYSGKILPRPKVPTKLLEPGGVFVTLTKNGELRGCIGHPMPNLPLIDALIDSAISAATRDPRFPPVSPKELQHIGIEVSVLTKPETLKAEHPKEYPKLIKIGRDGLIVEGMGCAGLLLPQVAVEYGWDAEEFLSNTCIKAGLMPDCWLERGVRVSRFSAQVFCEKKPGGEVTERQLLSP
ncbi:MAG: TIGR00296 family protein [Candidatus Hadarchaeum sp.]|uniref:TIGR00296 family protein n=1 Tax=Candidatus Hadarchaeum sp. TaxID=2883567 RepID=UPI0031811033